MKNFVNKIGFILIVFCFLSCNNDCSFNKGNFTKQLEVFNRIKDSLLKNESTFLKIEGADLAKYVSEEDFKKIKELNINSFIKYANGVVVISFKCDYKKNLVEKKIDSNLKSCEVYLFFAENEESKKKILNYEQYLECRMKKVELNKNWTYVLIINDCS